MRHPRRSLRRMAFILLLPISVAKAPFRSPFPSQFLVVIPFSLHDAKFYTPRYVSKLSQRWLAALGSLGIPTNDHSLAGNNIGVSQQPSDINPSNTSRSYAAQ